MILQSFRDYLNLKELRNSWIASGAAGFAISCGVAFLSYWQNTLSGDRDSIISGLLATLIALGITQLKKLKDGKPSPLPPSIPPSQTFTK